MSKIRTKNSGFTLVELLVSIFILGVSLTAIMFSITASLNSASTVKNNYIASLLVQEGMEVVRNVRDAEWFSSATFGNNLPAGVWEVQWDSTAISRPFSNARLKKDNSGSYSYTSGTDTPFSRRIEICKTTSGSGKCINNAAAEVMVTVQVSWDERGQTKTVNAEEHLFNWFRN